MNATVKVLPPALERAEENFKGGQQDMVRTTKKTNRNQEEERPDMWQIVGRLVGEKSLIGLIGLSIAGVLWYQYLGLLAASEKKWEANAIAMEKRLIESKEETRLFSQIVAANTAVMQRVADRLPEIERAISRP